MTTNFHLICDVRSCVLQFQVFCWSKNPTMLLQKSCFSETFINTVNPAGYEFYKEGNALGGSQLGNQRCISVASGRRSPVQRSCVQPPCASEHILDMTRCHVHLHQRGSLRTWLNTKISGCQGHS